MRGVVAVNHDSSTSNLALLAKAIALGGDTRRDQIDIAERLGMPERVKAAVAAGSTIDPTQVGLTSAAQIATSFFPILRNTSVFYRLLADGLMRKLPLRMRVSFTSGAAAMAVIGEAQAIRVTRMTTDEIFLDPYKSTGILIFTKELLKWLTTGGEAFLSTELRRAITKSVDAGFLDLIEDGSTPTQASSGSTESAALADVYNLFEAVQLTSESKPLLIASPDVARRAATLIGGGGRAFPNMGPTGGEMCGVACMAVDALAAGTLGLIDGAGIAGDSEGITITSSNEALVQMSDTPDSPATASTTLISLFQSNQVGLKPEAYFAAHRLRDNAYAKITGVQWNASGNSPA